MNDMQLVPLIQQPVLGTEERLDVAGVAAMKSIQPVEEGISPPLVKPHNEPSEKIPDDISRSQISRQEADKVIRQSDRRLFCRRVDHQIIMQELRSSIDRRRFAQRKTDIKLHIDEMV